MNHKTIVSSNISVPIIDDITSLPQGSIFQLLFSDVFDPTNYIYKFKEIGRTYLSKSIYERINATKDTVRCYITDDNGTLDLFDIEGETEYLLDYLKDYRKAGYVNIESISYNSLEKTLSKLIYLYLDVMIESNYTALNTKDPLSSNDNLLCTMFEFYVINEAYRKISAVQEDVTIRSYSGYSGTTSVNIIGWGRGVSGYSGYTGYSGYSGETYLVSVYKSSDYIANEGEVVNADSSEGSFTIYAPPDPSIGDKFAIFDISGTFFSNNVTVNRNGKKIIGLEDNFLCDVNSMYIVFVYLDEENGWRFYYW